LVGFGLTEDHVKNIERLPDEASTAAINADRTPRDGAWVADVTGVLRLKGWPKGMRVLVRAERPHPAAQLRFTDRFGNRLTAFATNTSKGQHADLELRHRQRARCEDRIRAAKDSGLDNLPLKDLNQNRVWLAVVMLAADITAWAQLLAPHRLRSPHLGTETAPAPTLRDPRPPRPPQPQHLAPPRRQRTPRCTASHRHPPAAEPHRRRMTGRPTTLDHRRRAPQHRNRGTDDHPDDTG
jgi:Transposase DDE domain group 1